MVHLTGLEPGQTYHYRIVASNEPAGTPQATYGEDASFTTTSTPPLLTGVGVTAITQTTATITGSLNPQGLPTRYELLLGTTPGALGLQTAADTSTPETLNLTVGSLSPSTVYYYRLSATSSDGTVSPAPEGSFTTSPGPPAGATPGLPALIPYTPVSAINAKEEAENKKNSKPPALTNKQKLAKALVACHKDKKKSKRAKCERAAHKKYPTAKKK